MKTVISQVVERYRHWLSNVTESHIETKRFVFLFVSWLITFFFIIWSIESEQIKWLQVWLVFHIYFWYHLNKVLITYFKPPLEVLILLLLLLTSLQNIFLNGRLTVMPEEISLGSLPALLLALQTLLAGLIIIMNGKAYLHETRDRKGQTSDRISDKHIKQGSLLLYGFLGVLAYHIILFEHLFVYYIFQFFLLVILLNKTAWLEELSKPLLITYFWIFLILFYFYSDPQGFHSVRFIDVEQKITWLGIPYYLHLFIKLYLLAVAIKIPIVLIYNHATLSRKMRIAGLFQSTFPQLIQFIFLCFIFFALISSWQAEEIRESIKSEIKEISNGKISPALSYRKLPYQQAYTSIRLDGYLPESFIESDHRYGIIRLTKTAKQAKRDFNKQDYFLFVRSARSNDRSLYLVEMDTNFVTTLTKRLSFFAGSGVISYPFSPREWQRFLFDIQFFQEEKEIKIYPFGLLSLNKDWSIQAIRSKTDQDQPRIIILGREDIFGDQKFIAGRIFMPVLNSSAEEQTFFAFDIYLDFLSVFRPSTSGQIVWFLLLIFLLFNSFVIGQVSKVGAQINTIIVDRFSHLKKGIQQIARGNFEHKFTMEGEDEFVELAGHFNQMGQQLKETIAQAREKERLDHELKIARQVQLSLLPSVLPVFKGFQVAASIKTANEIGGDFYDILELSKNKYLFTIGDVSGKGSSAAFYMAQFISLLRYSRQFSEKPDEIAIRMNKYFSTQIVDRQIFITAIIGVLDLQSNRVEMVRAGHTLPLLVPGDHNKAIGEVKLSGIGLGLTRTEQTFRKKIHTETITLNPGDMLVFYTDGVVEAAHPSLVAEDESDMIVYGEERFKDLISNSRDSAAPELISICVSDLNTFYSDDSPVDDYTLFVLQRNK